MMGRFRSTQFLRDDLESILTLLLSFERRPRARGVMQIL